MGFAENLKHLPRVSHLLAIELVDQEGHVAATIENKPGQAGSLVVYNHLGPDGAYAAAFDIREIRAGRLVDPEVLGNDIVVVDFSGTRSFMKDFIEAVPTLAVFLLLFK